MTFCIQYFSSDGATGKGRVILIPIVRKRVHRKRLEANKKHGSDQPVT